jgi:hypothetical protein
MKHSTNAATAPTGFSSKKCQSGISPYTGAGALEKERQNTVRRHLQLKPAVGLYSAVPLEILQYTHTVCSISGLGFTVRKL